LGQFAGYICHVVFRWATVARYVEFFLHDCS
jgi:hypothetical protein